MHVVHGLGLGIVICSPLPAFHIHGGWHLSGRSEGAYTVSDCLGRRRSIVGEDGPPGRKVMQEASFELRLSTLLCSTEWLEPMTG